MIEYDSRILYKKLLRTYFDQGRHGIESPNLKNEYRPGEGGEEAKPCVEDDCGNRSNPHPNQRETKLDLSYPLE